MICKTATLKFERMVKFLNFVVANILNGFGKDASFLHFPLLHPSFIMLLKLKPANQVQLEVRLHYIILRHFGS